MKGRWNQAKKSLIKKWKIVNAQSDLSKSATDVASLLL
jgi:hypothetical protein